MSQKRPSWDSIWMAVARIISRRSHDKRTRVGCVIVSEDNTVVLANGYNGAPRGFPHEPVSTEPGRSEFLHAELNACLKLQYHYPIGKVMYVTMSPCRDCARVLLQSNIKKVVYDEEYRDTSGIALLRKGGVEVFKFSDLESNDVLEEFHPNEVVEKLMNQLVISAALTKGRGRGPRKFSSIAVLPAFLFVLTLFDFVVLYLLR